MIVIRPATSLDAHAIRDIYNHYVLTSVVTFDTEISSTEFWASKITQLNSLKLPFIVAIEENQVIGFAYAGRWRDKAAYNQSVEDTLYLSPESIRKGIGTALLEKLIELCQAAGIRQMLAVISAEGAEASVALHESLGFKPVGRLEAVGYKFERWLDTLILQKSL